MKKIKYVILNAPLFLSSKNLGEKIFNGDRGVSMEYIEDVDHLKIHCGAETATIKNYGAIIETTAKEAPKAAPAPAGKIKAQAWTPQDHVHTDGPGKTRD